MALYGFASSLSRPGSTNFFMHSHVFQLDILQEKMQDKRYFQEVGVHMDQVYGGFAPLKERIRKEGKVLPGNIIKVDGF